MNIDDKLAEFEGLPRYTIGRTEYISRELIGFPKGIYCNWRNAK